MSGTSNRTVPSYKVSQLEVFNHIQRPISIILCGEEWGDQKRLVWGNHSCVKMWNGNSLEEIMARDFNKDMSEAVKQRNHEVARRCQAGETFSQLWTFYPGGVATTVEITFSEIWIDEENGQPPLSAVLFDVLNTQEIKEQVNTEGLRSIEMLRHLPVAVALFDRDGSLIMRNPKDDALFGDKESTENSEASNSTQSDFVRRFVDPDLGQRILTSIVENDGNVHYNIEAQQIVNGSINRSWFALQVQQSLDPVTGSPVLLYSARDITQIIEAKKQEQAIAIKSEFLSCIAHEIRTPLHQVNGFNELLGQTELTEEQREYVRETEAASNCMMSVLNDLLEFSKLEAGRMKIEEILFNLEDVVKGSLSAVSPLAEKKNLLLCNQMEDSTPRKVVGDPNRIRQILLNFLNNAIKFTNHGQVSLDVQWIDNDNSIDAASNNNTMIFEFSVRDTGIGISAEHQRVIFNKYEQGGLAIARQFGGTGLGLAICRGLVEAMHGTLGVDSEIGKGSRFWFRIPFGRAANKATLHSPSANGGVEKPAPLSSLDILVVEDNIMSQKLMKSMLVKIGHTVSIAEDGLKALEAVASGSFDLILMDVQMPNMDGMEATKRIRESFSPRDLPILGLTADYRPSELDRYIGVGMNSCIGKPVRLKVLQTAMDDVVLETRKEDS